MALSDNKPPILNILVVGFHHKLGCQVEFSHPPLITGSSGKNECPSGWKYLPTLALPDGSHNFVEDTVFFNLPSLMDPTESVFGVSCYRQIPVEKLKIRTADVTRSTVQKSVCILSRLPIYGYIEVKLALIADAFFEQGDFSCTEILIKAYQQLNACLFDDDCRRPLRNFYVGLSLREILLQWRHKTLMLFKLFLLQRRVVCFGSPVRNMCTLILGIASLMPGLLEKGFQEVACVRTSRPLSPMPNFTDSLQQEGLEKDESQPQAALEQFIGPASEASATEVATQSKESSPELRSCAEIVDDYTLVSSAVSAGESATSSESSPPLSGREELSQLDTAECPSDGGKLNERSNSLTRESSIDTLAAALLALIEVNPNEYRAPISIFASGNLCLPYLSLPYMDLLTDPSVLSYVIGTSNVLFQQKRQLSDVLVDIENANIDAHDPDLRRQVALSTEDLRFMDYLIKHVLAPKEDAEGSEQWIRAQFQGYMLALLRTTVAKDATAKDCDHFNAQFVSGFKKTQCFQEWYDVRPSDEFFSALPAGHPFAGTLSVADVKLKLAQTMQNSESGRKINQAVNTTSRAVGGAISQAKGAFSNWWSSFTTAPPATASGCNNANDDVPSVTTTAQDITVAFQSNSSTDIEEAVVNIHIDETVVLAQTKTDEMNESSTSLAGSEKLVDCAEELEENSTINDAICKSPESFEQIIEDAVATVDASQKCGIVEIGHEAELELEKDLMISSVVNAVTSTRSNGDVFIV